ncbi:hypothetical protein NUU61_006803 [Penicillium alfredii]|uniref:G-patch domain-containing protein n=1 Tax=Penicillium alfredii TaxID=1506179 RepID=A0A9W9K3N8_9EURO|nr:uncharacterized protein NUU61_006803 [Penicillium alfredii]KAJ5091933.1 hypothetical protein NUU61_006803 [Penicillium alfredii]
MPPHDDDDYFLPLEDQRVFGAGIRRTRVPFVRSSEHELNTTGPGASSSSTPPGASIANTYLSIVMKQQPVNTRTFTSPNTPTPQESTPPPRTAQSAPPTAKAISPPPPPASLPTQPPYPGHTNTPTHCEVCNLPLSSNQAPSDQTPTTTRPHEASLAHQVCLTHSHPPSHLDRSRAGLRYLSTYGWDPDSRLGLGAPGREGIREPLKGRIKNDTAGLGVGLDADGDRVAPRPPPPKVQNLNAKQARRGAAEARRKGEKLRNMFFQSDEVLKYLGESA